MAREGLKELAGRIGAHPRFPVAAARATQDFVNWRTRMGVFNKVMSNFARERILEHLLYLHFARDPDVGHGATFERLAALSVSRDRIGARAVRTALRLAQIAGQAVLTRSREDGRLRIYEPTDALLAEAGEQLQILFAMLEEFRPDLRVQARLRSEPEFLRQIVARLGRAYLASHACAEPETDPYASLLRLEGARPILATVVERYLEGRDLPAAPELARRFHVSASQTRAVLKTAETLGLLRLGERGRLLEAEPLKKAYFDRLCRSLAFLSLYGLESRVEIPQV